MEAHENPLRRMTETTGTIMIIIWTFVLGPVGFLLLLGTAYAMISGNLALGIVCGLLMFSPLLVTAVWAPLVALTLLVERFSARAIPAPETNLTR